MRTSRWAVGVMWLAAAVGVALVAGGCARGARAEPRRTARPASEDAVVHAPSPSSYPPVAKAETRERALGILTALAQTGSPEERANAIEGLVPTPARLAAVIQPALLDENDGLRAVAALAVGKARLTASAGAVAPLLRDPSPWVRSGAIFAMKRCGQSVDLSPLAEMMVGSIPRLRAQAAFILGELGEKSAIPMLREIARSNLGKANPSEVRLMELQIAEARLKLGDDAALADIRTALFPATPEDLEAAILACQVVGQVRDQAAANQLIQLAAQKDPAGQPQAPEVRLAAAGALAQLNHEPRKARFVALEFFAGEKETLRAQSAFVLGQSRDPSVLAILARMMDDPVGRVRVAAAAAIVRMTERE